MRIHEMKCKTNHFEQIIAGNMPFIVRENLRDYELGDVLALNEVTALEDIYTGRCCVVVITSILQNPSLCKEDYIILGFRPCTMDVCDPYSHGRQLLCDKRNANAYAVPVFDEILNQPEWGEEL